MIGRKIAMVMALAVAASMMLVGTALANGNDRNRDGLPDRWEKAHHLSQAVKQAGRDQDHDGLKNRGEWRARLDPWDDDTDDDGTDDSDENAGTVKSFEDDVLTLTLAGGGELSAKVTDDTDIECDSDPGDDHGDHGHHHGHKGHRHHGRKHHHGHKHHHGPPHPPGPDGPDAHASNDGDNEHCGTDALVAGTKVLEAELKVIGGEAVWTDLELLKP